MQLERRCIYMTKLNERLTWNEIVEQYPDTWVGLKDIIREENSADIASAIVMYTSNTKTSDELLEMVFNNELELSIYTTPDNVFQLGMVGVL